MSEPWSEPKMPASSLRPITVLNVNDDDIARYTIGRMLTRAGIAVVEARTGEDALRALVDAPDVVLLDVHLPDMTGIEVCRRIKASPATAAIPVLLTSAAFVSVESRVLGLEGGADGYLVQPAEAIEIVANVRALVRARRAEEDRAVLLEREREARAQADEAREQAERANQLKDEFLSTVSHELRTPLNAILGWALMLRTGRLDDPDRDKAIAVIERNARMQAQIVEDLLDVSRILSGKLRVEFRAVDVGRVLRDAADAVRPTAMAKGVTLELQSRSSEAATVYGDPDRLQQVVWNLLSNAVKFTPHGGRVEVDVTAGPDEVTIAVRDTGMGIAPEFLPFVFDRFRQLDGTTARKYGGLGLGLSIVRHLVELHGGRVSARSEGTGRGSTFSVTLLARAPAISEALSPVPQLRRHAAPVPASQRPLEGLRVLVVEDQDDSRDMVRVVLERFGARVDSVATAREALEAMARRPDVLVSDIGLPDRDGYDLLRAIRALPHDAIASTPAIALTAYAREHDAMLAFAAGFQRHVPKPIDPDLLASIVAELGRGREAR